jgi:surface protein
MKSRKKIQLKNKKNLIKIIHEECEKKGWESDLNFIDTSLITDMSYLFCQRKENLKGYGLEKFNGDISEWDVSNVTNMKNMFRYSEFNKDISKWNTGNVTHMDFMFSNSKFNQKINSWNTKKVMSMSFMFSESIFNQDISKWDVSNVVRMSYMFNNSKFNGDISQWNVSDVENMSWMFNNSVFNGDISQWNTCNVEDMNFMFRSSIFNGDISQWNNCNVEDMSWMFVNSQITKIPKWNYFKPNNLEKIFDDCNKLEENLPEWYQFNHIEGGENRKRLYEEYKKNEKLNNVINNQLIIKNNKINKI